MLPRVRVPPEEEDEAPPPPPPQPANTSNATTSADINASNLLLTLINLPSSANNSMNTQLLTSVRHCRIRFLRFRHLVAPDTGMPTGRCPFGQFSSCLSLGCTSAGTLAARKYPRTSPPILLRHSASYAF